MAAVRVLAVALVWGSSAALAQQPAPTAPRPVAASRCTDSTGMRLSPGSRLVIAQAVAEGRPALSFVVAGRLGRAASLRDTLRRLGVGERFVADTVGYLRLVVPLDRVAAVSQLADIEAIQVDVESLQLFGAAQASTASPGRTTPAENPYLPTQDIGAPQFVRAHPTFDGRGSVIAVVEGAFDPRIPELRTARTLDGRPTRKILDFLTAVQGTELAAEFVSRVISLPQAAVNRWISMHDSVLVRGDTFTVDGVVHRAPRDGVYRFGRSPVGAVLWERNRDTVWVDVNHNGSFADEQPMTSYRIHGDVGLLPDTTGSAVGGGAFFVQTDAAAEAVRVEDRLSAHAGMVASTAAGAGFFDGAFDGVAPAAQLLSVDVPSNWHHSEIEGLITAFQDRRTDVVQLAMGGASLVNDGHEVLDIITDRLIATSGKLAAISAMNLGPGMGTTGSPSVASQAVSVGAAMPRATWRVNFGVPVAAPVILMPSSSRGPRGDGALKPDLVAPTGGFAAGVAGKADAFGLNLTYRPPAGYLIGGGTSQAAPFVAGAIALLISGARQTYLPHDPPRLKRALLAGAHPLAGYQAYEQGNGLLDVRRAWAALQRMRQTPLSTIVTCAPVHTVASRDMVVPNAGAGLYEREGWRAGRQGTRIVTFRRLDGPTDPVTYRVRWAGNDGTFASASAVTLPRGASVAFPVHIGPVTPGVHSARLDLVDPRDGLMAHQMLATVVATQPFTGRNGYTVVQVGQVPRPGSRSLFFAVPPGVPAVRFALTLRRGVVQPRFYPPAPSTAFVTGGRIANYQQATRGHPVSWSQTFAHPAPGVWEMVLDNSSDLRRRDSTAPVPLPPAEFRVTASLLGVNVGGETDSGLVVTNPYARAPVEARVVWGSVYRQDLTMRQGVAPFIHTLTVPAEATALAVMTDHPSDSAADLTLAVFECPAADRCVLRGVSLEAGGVHRVTVPRPRAGTWKVVVDPVHVTSEMIQVRYREAYFQPPAMDSLLTRPSLRRAGDHWVMVVGQRLAPRPDTVPGRTIEPVVQVTSPAARRLDRVDDPDLSKRYDPFQVPPAGWSEVPLGEWWYGEGAAPR